MGTCRDCLKVTDVALPKAIRLSAKSPRLTEQVQNDLYLPFSCKYLLQTWKSNYLLHGRIRLAEFRLSFYVAVMLFSHRSIITFYLLSTYLYNYFMHLGTAQCWQNVGAAFQNVLKFALWWIWTRISFTCAGFV